MTVAPPSGGIAFAPAPPAAGKGSERSFNAAIIQLLRQIMQNARDANASIDALKRLIELNTNDRKAASEREFLQYVRNSQELDSQIARASTMADQDPAFDVGDQVTLIEDAWNRAKDAVPKADVFAADAVAASVVKDLDTAKDYVKNVHFYAARLSAPSQVRQYVLELRPGNTASIHDILKEDIPDEAQRNELIRYMKTAHISIPGIIDVETGIITRYETDKKALNLSFYRVLLAGLGVPALALIASWFWPSFPQLHSIATPQQVSTFFPILGGVWAGAILHVVFDIIKARKGTPPDYVASVDDFRLYVNSKEISILIGIGVLILVAGATAWVGPTLGFGGSFFVGYIPDSMADVVLERFQKVVDTQTGNVKTVLGGG